MASIFQNKTLLILTVFLMTMSAYIPAMQGGFIWDDDDYVTHNTVLQSWDGLKSI